MNDALLLEIKNTLDLALKGAPPRTGIAFGTGLFDAFRRKEWITLAKLGLGGLGFPDPIPVYDNTHFVICSWGVAEMAYQIGSHA